MSLLYIALKKPVDFVPWLGDTFGRDTPKIQCLRRTHFSIFSNIIKYLGHPVGPNHVLEDSGTAQRWGKGNELQVKEDMYWSAAGASSFPCICLDREICST